MLVLTALNRASRNCLWMRRASLATSPLPELIPPPVTGQCRGLNAWSLGLPRSWPLRRTMRASEVSLAPQDLCTTLTGPVCSPHTQGCWQTSPGEPPVLRSPQGTLWHKEKDEMMPETLKANSEGKPVSAKNRRGGRGQFLSGIHKLWGSLFTPECTEFWGWT